MTDINTDNSISLTVGEEIGRTRLDRFLAGALADLSRTRVQDLIRSGHVVSNGETINDPSYRVNLGQPFTVTIPAATEAEPQAQDIPLDVVYEDEHLLIIDKPAGMVVHPAPGSPDGTLVNALLAHCGDSLSGIGGVKRPGIVHRIDKDTSGLLVVAKTDQAHHGLSEQFAAHSVNRAYLAVVWGVPSPRRGKIEGNIGRSPHDRKKMAVVRSGGKTAVTRYKVLENYGMVASLIECRLETGRTHQIRVHMTSKGHALIGDPVYGRGMNKLVRNASEELKSYLKSISGQALHADLIGFSHPIHKEYLEFKSKKSGIINELRQKLERG